MLFDLFKPINYIYESIISSNIICQKNAMSSSVKNSSYGTEGFLAGCVPNLKFHNLLINLSDKRSEFNTNSYLMLYFELIIHDSSKQTTLSNTYTLQLYLKISKLTSISNDNQLK